MTIQGIIEGYADPSDVKHHAVVIGRGNEYHVILDGSTFKTRPDLGAAIDILHDHMSVRARTPSVLRWQRVISMVSPSIGLSEVTALDGSWIYELGRQSHEDQYTETPQVERQR